MVGIYKLILVLIKNLKASKNVSLILEKKKNEFNKLERYLTFKKI